MTKASLPDDQRPTLPPGRRAGVLWDGRYRLVRQLGRGGFGEVWLAIDTQRNDQRVALKIILSQVVDEVPDFATRFTREILVLRALRHPGVPQIFNDGRTATGEFFYTMEFVAGETLGSWIKQPRAAADAMTVMAQVAEILSDCHARGVVHRDLKPANIMLHRDADTTQVFVLDFGIAKVVQRGKDLADIPSLDSKIVIGTAAYMSPEQLRGDNPTPAADVFALGIVLHEVLLGERPQHGVTDYELAAARLAGDQRIVPRANLAEGSRQLMESMLRFDPAQRPSMADVAKRLRGEEPARAKARKAWPRAALYALAAIAALGISWRTLLGGGATGTGAADPPRPPGAGFAVAITAPAAGTTVGRNFRIQGRVTGTPPGPLVLAGTRIDPRGGAIDHPVTWSGGDGEVDLLADVARDAPHKVVLDVTPPAVEIAAPAPGTCVAAADFEVAVRATDQRSALARVVANDVALEPDGSGVFRGRLTLAEGDATIAVTAEDAVGNVSPPVSIPVTCDLTAPELTLDEPRTIRSLTGKVTGKCTDRNLRRLTVNDVEVRVDATGAFAVPLTFSPSPDGKITVAAVAIDRADRSTRKEFTVPYARALLSVVTPRDGARVAPEQTVIEVRGRGNARLGRVTINERLAELDGSEFTASLPLVAGANKLTVRGTDDEGNAFEPIELTVTREEPAAAPSVPAGCEPQGGQRDAAGRALAVRHLATQQDLVLVPHGSRPFYLGKYEVTVGQYADFCARMRRPRPPVDKADHPITGIRLADAEDFCANGGLRLPTTDEWALAAAGPPPGRTYPWEGPWDPQRCNNADAQPTPTSTAAVGARPGDVTPEGHYDMAGNVQEYVASPDKTKPATVCGGAFTLGQRACTASARATIGRDKTPNYVGFRVALDAR